MLSRVGRAVLGAGLLLMALGMVLGNYYVLLAGTFPLLVVLAGASIEAPHAIEVERRLDARTVPVGAVVRLEVRVRVAKGLGLVEVHCPLPDPFVLVEGSNLHVYRKGPKPLEAIFALAMRCTKRGPWSLAPTSIEAVHAFGLRAPQRTAQGAPLALEVRPRVADLRRVRDVPGYARHHFPHGDLARTGTRTTDFRELRQYAPGDPPRSINWKATARRAARLPPQARAGSAATPLVNEYEHEGRKTVWLFVDAASYLEVGSDVHNAFEAAVEAAGGLARFYLDRGFRLGAYVYNGHDQLLHPDTGTGQYLKLEHLLTTLRAREPWQGLPNAVQRCRGHLAEDKPYVVVVTRATEDTERLAEGVRRIRGMAGNRRRRLPVTVVSPAVYSLLTDGPRGQEAAQLLRRLDRPALAKVRALGATVVEWDPRQHPFASAMLWGVR